MRRIILPALAMLLLAGVLPASAQEVSGGGGAVQWAMGAWVTWNKGKPQDFYAADAVRGANVGWGDVGTLLWAAKGRCKQVRGGYMCSASGRVYEGDLDDFEFDPGLGSAAMTLETKRYTHRVSWTGDGEAEPNPYVEPLAGHGYNGFWVGVDEAAWADPTGRLFGRRMRPRAVAFGVLYQGAGGHAIVYVDGAGRTYELSRQVDGERMSTTLRIST